MDGHRNGILLYLGIGQGISNPLDHKSLNLFNIFSLGSHSLPTNESSAFSVQRSKPHSKATQRTKNLKDNSQNSASSFFNHKNSETSLKPTLVHKHNSLYGEKDKNQARNHMLGDMQRFHKNNDKEQSTPFLFVEVERSDSQPKARKEVFRKIAERMSTREILEKIKKNGKEIIK